MGVGKLVSGQPHEVDIHVGKLVRARRKAIGMSQVQLAEQLGLTFQQVQKYERGGNRISASKLYEISRALDVPAAYFFEGIDLAGDGAQVQNAVGPQTVAELTDAFRQVKSDAMRNEIVKFVRSLAV